VTLSTFDARGLCRSLRVCDFTTSLAFVLGLTEAVEQTTFSPVFDYKKVHHIPCVTAEFVKYLKGAIEMQIHVSQHIDPPSVSS
jgi:hypothetical protein